MAKKTATTEPVEPETVEVETVEAGTVEVEPTPEDRATDAITNLVVPSVMGLVRMGKSGKISFSLTLDNGNVTGEFYTSFFETSKQ